MRNSYSICAFALTAALAVAAVPAQAKPNLAGDWKLNVERSNFGEFPAPLSMTMKNTHEEPALKVLSKVTSGTGEESYDMTFRTDGGESVNMAGPTELKTRSNWEGGTLVMTTKGTFGDTEVTLVDKWDLAEDGRTLTIRRHWSSSRGEVDQKLVFEKQ
jgi:hypothetical protein